jgi:low temperature requirement protein LtrA
MGHSRRRTEGEGQRATALELFYDLVFVFAITQVSHLLLEHLTWAGVGQSLLVLLVVWWSWNYTTWATNELDTEAITVRLLMISLMLLSLLMAVAIPQAFEGRALLFAASYVAIQVGRHAFLRFVAWGRGTVERERAGRILIWFVAAGVLWIFGALVEGPARVALWLAALALDYGAPLVVYWVPGLRRMTGSVWNVGTEHFAERFQLFIIIALGETIVITGATTADLDLDAARLAAFGSAFVTAAAMWWLYFNYVARIAQRQLELSENRTSLARDGYTYLHVVMVAGIIVSAVGDELVIAHPEEVLPAAEIAVVVGGPGLYLLAHALFRRRMTGKWGPKRLYGAAGCLAVGALGPFVPALVLAGLVIAVLAAVIASEHVAASRRAHRGEPTPLERLEASAGTRATSPAPPGTADPG